MDRTGWIVVIACVGLLFFWQARYGAEQARRQVQARELAAKTAAAAEAARGAPAPGAAAVEPARVEPPPPEVPERLEEIRSPQATFHFTTRGGGIAWIDLSAYRSEGEDRVRINAPGSLPIGALTDVEGRAGREPWQIRVDDGKAQLWREPVAGVRVEKEFLLPPAAPTNDPFVTEMVLRWVNGAKSAFDQAGVWLALGRIGSIHRGDWPMYTAGSWWQKGRLAVRDVTWFDAKRVPLLGIVTRPQMEYTLETGNAIEWAGVKNQFFTSIMTPREGSLANGVWLRRHDPGGRDPSRHAVEGSIGFEGFTLQPGETREMRVQLYTGPTEYGRLRRFAHHEAEILNYGMFGFVSKPLHFALLGLQRLVRDYGVAIIILTVLIKLGLWPMQNRATESMKRMSALSPKITELREKYKDDPTRMNKEMMDLYKKNGVNPFAGCLPMFVQIPIFFGFYKMLQVAVELRDSGFLWVRDLSQPDTVWHVPHVPIAGDLPVNILPLIMGATMVWQMVISPKSGDKVQQRILYIMPVVFLAFCYNFAAALSLYWTVQNIFSIVQLYATRNRIAAGPVAGNKEGGGGVAARGLIRPAGATRRRKGKA